MPGLPFIIAGLAWPMALTGAPPGWLWLVLAALAIGLLAFSLRFPSARLPAFVFLAAAWSCWHVEQGLALRVERGTAPTLIQGHILSLPERRGDGWVFDFQARGGPWGAGSRRLEVRWYETPETPRAGERWRLPLRISPPRGRVNFAGSDAERHWFGARIHGLAVVTGQGAERRPGAGRAGLATFRQTAHDALAKRLDGLPGSGLVLALGLGERQGLSAPLREAMRATGTGHLLAISGLHVGLVALFGFWLARGALAGLVWRGQRWPSSRLAIVLGLGAATGYALLAGFGTSPRRALVMLTVAAIAWLWRRHSAPWQGWTLALAVVLVLDPLAPLQAGFWLSFGAVAVLLYQFADRRPVERGARALLRAQYGLTLVLIPLGMAWFQWVTLSGLLVNLLAIPWVSFVTLPLVLLSLVMLPFDGSLAEVVPHMAARSASWLETALIAAAEGAPGLTWRSGAPGRLSLVLAIGGGLLMLLPRGLRLRRFGLLLWLPALIPAPGDLADGALRLDLLDVGQGQAALVSTRGHLLVADTGPGQPERWDLVNGVLLPAIAGTGHSSPDLLLVSHGDLDHAGGLDSLRRHWPGVSVVGNSRRRPAFMTPCTDALGWRWDGVDFGVLHPSPWLPYRGNDSSCVLSLAGEGGRMLLPGDVGAVVERRLARDHPGQFRLAVAPHHGSGSSSSATFLDWARADVLLLTAGYGNRFGFPHEAVVARFAKRALPVAGTAECGGLRFTLRRDGRLEGASARRTRAAFWRYAPAPHCPGSDGVPPLTSPSAFRYHAGHTDKNFASKE